MKKEEFRQILMEFASSLDDEEDIIPEYNKREFASMIMEYGESSYHIISQQYDVDSICETVRNYLDESFEEAPYFVVRPQEYCISIAAPIYIKNAPETIGKALGIIPDVFTEVSGPMSTVLILDCEKQFLRKTYLGLGVEEWLL